MQIIPDKLKDDLKDNYVEYSAGDIRSAWQANTDYAHLQLLQIDSKYRALRTEDWKKVMNDSDTRTQKYIADFYDCNHFAFLFKAEVGLLLVNGCGLVLDFSGQHAFNVAVIGDDSKKPAFRFIEPQGDNWIIANSKPYYNLKGQGLIIL